ncbi:TIGR04076 family protein [Candidatus Bathyarchaeota archaeon]|nr:TIGR04076 family protein [Candidatus Bathyarchaeota archaeon]
MTGLTALRVSAHGAFADIHRDINHLMRGGDFPWVGKPGVTYSACTDGKKPVVFKLERVE